jgi:hypothetical protein
MDQVRKQVESVKTHDAASAAVVGTATLAERLGLKGTYRCELLRVKPEFKAEADGLLAQLLVEQAAGNTDDAEQIDALLKALPRESVWVDTIHNVITDVGVHDMLDKYLGLAAQTGIFMGLKGTGTATAAHTQASHAAWLEQGAANAPTYSGTRKTPTLGAATTRTKATSSASSFTFTGGGTVYGCFINLGGTSAIDNTTGILFSAGDFSGGQKTVVATDVLNVSWQVQLT